MTKVSWSSSAGGKHIISASMVAIVDSGTSIITLDPSAWVTLTRIDYTTINFGSQYKCDVVRG